MQPETSGLIDHCWLESNLLLVSLLQGPQPPQQFGVQVSGAQTWSYQVPGLGTLRVVASSGAAPSGAAPRATAAGHEYIQEVLSSVLGGAFAGVGQEALGSG